jgi:hypothetical protein
LDNFNLLLELDKLPYIQLSSLYRLFLGILSFIEWKFRKIPNAALLGCIYFVGGDINTAKESVMKNTIKVLGIIALVAVIGVSFVACGDGGDDGGGGGKATVQLELGATFTYFPGPEISDVDAKKGWLLDETALAKLRASQYLVIETKGVGDNEWGFGGIQIILVYNIPPGPEDWNQSGINGDWVAFTRADDKTVYIVVELAKLKGIDGPIGAIVPAYYGEQDGKKNNSTLMLQNAYLVSGNLAKPTDAVALTNNDVNYGYLCEGLDF